MSHEENNFGVPRVDYTPIGSINMEGNFFRGLSDKKAYRPTWVRYMAIFFCAFCLFIPGVLYLGIYLYIAATNPGGVLSGDMSAVGWATLIMSIGLGAIMTAAGFIGIKANIKKHHPKATDHPSTDPTQSHALQ